MGRFDQGLISMEADLTRILFSGVSSQQTSREHSTTRHKGNQPGGHCNRQAGKCIGQVCFVSPTHSLSVMESMFDWLVLHSNVFFLSANLSKTLDI